MKSLLRAILFFAMALTAPATSTFAQEQSWREKTVWTVTYVETTPGMFNDYMKDLSGLWLSYIKQAQKDGKVVSYKILNNMYPRDSEPDIMILVEYKNMAAFDNEEEYTDELFAQVNTSWEQTNKALVDREKLRKFRGIVLTRELEFPKPE